jgi:hypothetical protein
LIFCVIVFVPLLLILFILGGIDAVTGTELHEKFINSTGKILDKVKHD